MEFSERKRQLCLLLTGAGIVGRAFFGSPEIVLGSLLCTSLISNRGHQTVSLKRLRQGTLGRSRLHDLLGQFAHFKRELTEWSLRDRAEISPDTTSFLYRLPQAGSPMESRPFGLGKAFPKPRPFGLGKNEDDTGATIPAVSGTSLRAARNTPSPSALPRG